MSEKNQKRILLVDDEEQVLFVVSESLNKLGAEAEIITAGNGEEALEKIKANFFDLVITDLKMPKMNGIKLTDAIKNISPETQVIWMTAFGNDAIQKKAKSMGVRHFLAKPLDIADIRKIAQEAFDATMERKSREDVPALSGQNGVKKVAQQLKADTDAFAILIITTAGSLVEAVGITQDLNVNTLSALIAGNFMASNQIAQMLGRESNFKLSYHESDLHNIYSYGVGEDYLLITVFGGAVRPGVVWFYAQQAAANLEEILAQMDLDNAVSNSLEGVFSDEIDNELSDILDTLWSSNPKQPIRERAISNKPQVENTHESEGNQQNTLPITPVKTLSYEEAVNQGVIPDNIV